MKKLSIFALACLLVITLSACTNTDQANDVSSSSQLYDQEQIPEATSDLINDKENNTYTMSEEFKNIEKAIIKTNKGNITVSFYKNESPKTVENFMKLAKEGFYDGTRFHRIIEDFMIQGGDPLSKDVENKSRWGTGGPDYRFEDEINDKKIVRGSLAMANAGPNTNGSQFFIVTAEATPWLDGAHTNFGMVEEGLDVVMDIASVEVDGSDRPVEDVVIESITLE